MITVTLTPTEAQMLAVILNKIQQAKKQKPTRSQKAAAKDEENKAIAETLLNKHL